MAKSKYVSNWKPDFTNWEKLDGYQFSRLRDRAWSYYYEELSSQEIIANIFVWMKKNGYTQKQIQHAKAGKMDITHGIVACILLDGCPSFNPIHNEYWNSLEGTRGDVQPLEDVLRKRIEVAIDIGKTVKQIDETNEVIKKEVSVQENMKQKLSYVFEYIEEYLDDWMYGNDISKFDLYRQFQNSEFDIKPAHARLVLSNYESLIQEIQLLVEGTDSELNECYEGVTKKQKNELLKLLEKLQSACNMIIESGKKIRKPRKQKTQSKEKLVAKLNYKETDTALSLVSINPIDILDAKELWVYNTKNRRLGRYVVDEHSVGLSVKGSTLQGFNESKSVDKTLRKPEEILKEFKSAGKVKLRKFLEDINSKEKPMSGRINKDIILLKTIR